MPKILKSDSNSYLVGGLIDKINGEELPTNKVVLSRFLLSRTKSMGHKTVSESLKECGSEVENIWALAEIPTQNHYRVLDKIKSLFSEWNRLKKNKPRNPDRNPDNQCKNEKKFCILLEALFDISYNDSLNKMKSEDKERLSLQGNVIRVADKLNERKEYFERLKQMLSSNENYSPAAPAPEIKSDEICKNVPFDEICEQVSTNETETRCDYLVNGEVNSDSGTEVDFHVYSDISIATIEDDSDESADSDEEYLPPSKYRKKTEKKKKSIMTPELSEALDRTKTSSRSAVYILALGALGMGLDPRNMIINRESIRQYRIANNRESAIQMQENFNPKTPLVLHWDGKLLPNSELNQKVDRIAVIVTGHEISQLLGVPYLLESATGKSQAESVIQTVRKWIHVPDKIEFLCFDTTNVNSGRIKGTCVWLQNFLGNCLKQFLSFKFFIRKFNIRRI